MTKLSRHVLLLINCLITLVLNDKAVVKYETSLSPSVFQCKGGKERTIGIVTY